MHQRLSGTDGGDVDSKAQPDCSGLGQLSSPRLLGQNLLERGPDHPLSNVEVGQTNASEQVLRLAEAEILQPSGTIRVLRAEAQPHWRNESAALAQSPPNSPRTPR